MMSLSNKNLMGTTLLQAVEDRVATIAIYKSNKSVHEYKIQRKVGKKTLGGPHTWVRQCVIMKVAQELR